MNVMSQWLLSSRVDRSFVSLIHFGLIAVALANVFEIRRDVFADVLARRDVQFVAGPMASCASGVTNLRAARDVDRAIALFFQRDDPLDGGGVDLVKRGAFGTAADRAVTSSRTT